jgi:hypothetical protein
MMNRFKPVLKWFAIVLCIVGCETFLSFLYLSFTFRAYGVIEAAAWRTPRSMLGIGFICLGLSAACLVLYRFGLPLRWLKPVFKWLVVGGRRMLLRVVLAVIILALAAIFFVSLRCFRSASSPSLKQRTEAALGVKLETLRAEGLPITLAELDKWYGTPPPEENAATILQQAFALYVKPAASSGRHRNREEDARESPLPIINRAPLPPASEPLPAEMGDAIAEFLLQNEAALKLLHIGTSMRACRYPIDLTKGSFVLLPHLSNVRMGTWLLALEMLWRIDNDQPDSAIDSSRDCFGLARTLAREPVLISQLVRLGCQLTIMPCLQRLLTRTALSDEQLERLDRILIDAEEPEGLTRAFVGQRCNLVWIYELYRQQIRKPARSWPTIQEFRQMSWRDVYYYPQEVARQRQYYSSGQFELDVLVSFDLRTATIRASQLPFPEQLAAAKLIAREEDTYSRGGSSFMIMPASISSMIKQAKCAAALRAARGAIAVERYRLAHGAAPENVDHIPIADPFNGQPLRFKKLALGYVVYSVGDDERDDGGDEKRDITFAVDR